MLKPDGLLAYGGSLELHELLKNYRKGAFPWYTEGQPVIWWSPSKRLILRPQNLKVNRTLRRKIKKKLYTIHKNRDFEQVIEKCANTNERKNNTWITKAVKQAYLHLHNQGYAHSVECWSDGKLIGGLYGVSIGQIFFGESMFSLQNDASKLALFALCRWEPYSNYHIIDCQVESEHLKTLGAELIERSEFERILKNYCEK